MITRSSKVTFYKVSNPNAKEVSLSQYFLLMSQNEIAQINIKVQGSKKVRKVGIERQVPKFGNSEV